MAQSANTDWKIAPDSIPIVGTAVSAITYALRLYARHMVPQKLRTEDTVMGIGLIFGVLQCALSTVSKPDLQRATISRSFGTFSGLPWRWKWNTISELPAEERASHWYVLQIRSHISGI